MTDREQIIALARSFDAAWDDRDLERFLPHFTEDGSFGSNGGPVLRGQTELREHFAAAFPTLAPGLHHVSRAVAFSFPTPDVAVVDIEVDMEQETDNGTRERLLSFPATGIGLRISSGWRVHSIRTGPPFGDDH